MFKSILQKSEKDRKRLALGLSIIFSLFIFFGFAFYKGFLSFGSGNDLIAGQKSLNQMANVIPADNVLSPLGSSKETFGAAFDEIGKQYNLFKESVSAVFVPFVTSIEVYERSK